MASSYCVFNYGQARKIRQFIAIASHVYHVLSTKFSNGESIFVSVAEIAE